MIIYLNDKTSKAEIDGVLEKRKEDIFRKIEMQQKARYDIDKNAARHREALHILFPHKYSHNDSDSDYNIPFKYSGENSQANDKLSLIEQDYTLFLAIKPGAILDKNFAEEMIARIDYIKEKNIQNCMEVKNYLINSENGIDDDSEMVIGKYLCLEDDFMVGLLSEPKKVGDRVDYIFSPKQMDECICVIEQYLEKSGMEELKIDEGLGNFYGENDFRKGWNYSQVVKANNEIEKIANNIKIHELTPFEAMLYIHKYVTSNYEYNNVNAEKLKNKSVDRYEETQTIMGALSGGIPKIVCAGYASLVMAIIDKLGMEGLKCAYQPCVIYQKQDDNGIKNCAHVHNIIDIKDDKYKIDGVYVEDACWDSKNNKFPNGQGYGYCMVPISDVKYYKDKKYKAYNPEYRTEEVMGQAWNEKNKLASSNYKNWDEIISQETLLKDGQQSPPISYIKYKNGINNLSQKMSGFIKSLGDEIYDSVINAGSSYSNGANNSFYQAYNSDAEPEK